MKVQYRVAGDRFLIVKYGDSFDLKLNFETLILADRLRRMGIRGIQGITSAISSLMIRYDPFQISAEDLIQGLRREESGETTEKEVLRSRLIRMPLVYGDRWTRACAEKFQVPPNLEFVAEHNHMTVDELVRAHSSCTFWILFIGFTPGLPVFVPIDPKKRISAPKYQTPRTWTPVGTLGIGGITNCIYSIESPGGYQMYGRTPLLIYDLERTNPVFEKEIVLFRPGDRILFEPITHDEYLAIEKNFSSYKYQIEEATWTVSQFSKEG